MFPSDAIVRLDQPGVVRHRPAAIQWRSGPSAKPPRGLSMRRT